MTEPNIPYTNQEIADAAEFVGIEPKVLQVAIMVIYKDREFRQSLKAGGANPPINKLP